jgi:hypothetical protein
MCTIHETLHHPPTVITEPKAGSTTVGDQPDEAEAGAHTPEVRA